MFWKTEGEHRERNQLQGQLSKKKVEGKNDAKGPQADSSQTHTFVPLYLSPTGPEGPSPGPARFPHPSSFLRCTANSSTATCQPHRHTASVA